MGFISTLLNIHLLILATLLSRWPFSEAHNIPRKFEERPNKTSSFNKDAFPDHFVFGTASSSYQYEGAVSEEGRGPSIWDDFTHNFPEKIADGSNGDVTEDFYFRYKEDIKLMKSFGLDAFRLSISWSRVIPSGKLSKGVNKKGIQFYNKIINELLSHGIEPFVTIFHWDLPQALQNEYGGFLSPNVLNDYQDFAELCFKEFGDRVKNWITFNEPYMYSLKAYELGVFIGNISIDPYLVAHNILLSHSSTVQLYKEKYQATQGGQIGMVLICHWMVPYSNNKADSKAAQRALDFMFGWFIDPITYGEYPKSMRAIVGSRLPKFNLDQTTMLRNSYDFLGVNYYTGNYVADVGVTTTSNVVSGMTDSQVIQTFERNGKSIGEPTGGSQFYVYPKGLYDLLVYVKNKYNNPTIYVTENGMPDSNNGTTIQLIRDTQRVNFIRRHLLAVKQAIRDGVRVKGYFVWSFLDTWEWNSGYTVRFGLNFIDYTNGLRRIPKLSALWLKKFLRQDKSIKLTQYH